MDHHSCPTCWFLNSQEATQEAWVQEEAEKRWSKVLSDLSLPCAANRLQGTSPFGSYMEVTCVLSCLGPMTWRLLTCSVKEVLKESLSEPPALLLCAPVTSAFLTPGLAGGIVSCGALVTP